MKCVSLIIWSGLLAVALCTTRADTLIGTYDVNYRYNAAGCAPTGGPNDGNPYHCPSGIPPGPYFISAAAGHYKLVNLAGPGCGVWSGDETSGRIFSTGGTPNEIVEFDHQFGQIVLFYWDWYVGDNDPGIQTTIALYQTGAPDIRITRVTASDTGVLSGGELPFCSTDTIHCESSTTNADGLTIEWNFTPDSPAISLVPVSGPGLTTLDLKVVPPPWTDIGRARQSATMGLWVTARLLDGNVEKAQDRVHISQGQLGQLRQEYVDFPTPRVPAVSEFTSNHPELNSGDYPGLALITPWAITTAPVVIRAAANATPRMSTAVNSCYRNPVHHANIYLGLGVRDIRRMRWGSQHLYGGAIDFHVGPEFAPPISILNGHDYRRLKAICDQYGRVIVEHTARGTQIFNHVHLQLH